MIINATLKPGNVSYVDESERFWMKVDAADCWIWTAAKKAGGYGLFRRADQKQVAAHRWAYENLVGPIPDGLTVDHLCRVPACVNPDHMELVPPGTNTRRGYGPSAMNRRATHCAKGHEFEQGTKQRFCRQCRNAYLRKWTDRRRRAAGVPVGRSEWTARTECPKGHAYDDANTYVGKDGSRRCRTCLQASSRDAKRRKREAAKASQ